MTYAFDAYTVRNLDMGATEIDVDGDVLLLHQFYEANPDFTPTEVLYQIADLFSKGQFSVDTGNGTQTIVKAVGIIARNSDEWEWDAFPKEQHDAHVRARETTLFWERNAAFA